MTCEDCRFYGSCYMQERFEDNIIYTENAESMCKNFEEYCLPAKHGRLIDENELILKLRTYHPTITFDGITVSLRAVLDDVEKLIHELPTIIEANDRELF